MMTDAEKITKQAADADKVMQQAAEYVAETQPQLDKIAAEKRAWDNQAQRTAGVLADRGCLRREQVNEFVDKLAEDPRFALTYLEKLARTVGADSLGEPSTEVVKVASDKIDPFVAAFCPDLVQASGSGLID